jgi:hypothetical protein
MAHTEASCDRDPLLLDQRNRLIDRIGGQLVAQRALLTSNLFCQQQRECCQQELIVFFHGRAHHGFGSRSI